MIIVRSPFTLFLLAKKFEGHNLTVKGDAVFVDNCRMYDDELSAKEVRMGWVKCSGKLEISP